jgi:hypothetical protein
MKQAAHHVANIIRVGSESPASSRMASRAVRGQLSQLGGGASSIERLRDLCGNAELGNHVSSAAVNLHHSATRIVPNSITVDPEKGDNRLRIGGTCSSGDRADDNVANWHRLDTLEFVGNAAGVVAIAMIRAAVPQLPLRIMAAYSRAKVGARTRVDDVLGCLP